jgi:hypothetical protein
MYLYTEYADTICLGIALSANTSGQLGRDEVSYYTWLLILHTQGWLTKISEFFRLHNVADYAVGDTVAELLILYTVLIVHLFILEVNIRWKANPIICVMYGIVKPYALYILW